MLFSTQDDDDKPTVLVDVPDNSFASSIGALIVYR